MTNLNKSDNWIDVLASNKLPIGERKLLTIKNTPIALLNINNEIFCIEDNCPHQDLPLAAKGELEISNSKKNIAITCPYHGAKFCLRTGEVKAPPAFSNINTFATRIKNNTIQINFTET